MATNLKQMSTRDKLVEGVKLQEAGEYSKAQRFYRQILRTEPKNKDALHLFGVAYRQLGKPKKALEYIQKAIAVDPNQSAFYANLARTMMDLGTDPDSLLAVTEKALVLDPKQREARNIRAIALGRLERFEEAENILQVLVVEYPNDIDAYQNFGQLLLDAKRPEHAVNFYFKAVMLAPDDPKNYILRARCRLQTKEYERSQYELSEALERFPDNADVLHEAARLLFSMNETNKGISFARQALAQDPKDAHKCVTLGVLLLMDGQSKDALKTLQEAERLFPGKNPSIEWNQSLAYLAVGDLANGWKRHPARRDDPASLVTRRTFEKPLWKGEDLKDKTILIWTDQGLGDALKSGTMLPDLEERAGKIIVEASPKAMRVMKQTFPKIIFRNPTMDKEKHATADDYDYHANITDIAEIFRPTIDSFKLSSWPVYNFDLQKARDYLQRLTGHDAKPVIGFSWRSRNLAANRARYYLSAPNFAPILASRDAIFVNLQYKAIDKEIQFFKTNFPEQFHNFDDVDLFDDLISAGSLTACCDFVVSANTSVADMAGILDIPSIRFGQQEPPLLLGQNNPPWYPSMTYMHPYTDRPCADFVPEIIAELDRQLENWTPERRNQRLGL
ncbi:tetratricopeptide repeat protein [Roseibium denhamense]|uniref:Tetratricopeptide repeat-containing protein n=1 Tax=Roseibium denhamense TaxID=76305 RepID=A0ABY1NVQ5_9HYPH|nr:tetratricopeptide repeat protein [Roseibium denhamense]MTI05443.1 tetratricopeptide repeat protein [Roseibium denhamense]SMP18607.1 Tetratricopeptide repeat-containing protein [Roseibium denhamense]